VILIDLQSRKQASKQKEEASQARSKEEEKEGNDLA
jgi:hypothetical protein